jgi:cell wall-associated NlpC family hydrolase
MNLTTHTRSARTPARFVLPMLAAAMLCAPANSAWGQTSDKPFEAYSLSAQALRDSIVRMAKAQVGTRYKYGGTTPERGFDCSGLIRYVMAAFDMRLPRTARQQARAGLAVNRDTSRLLPGDLLTFAKSRSGTVSHIGIYVGNGRFIHASSAAGQVIESAIYRPPSPLIKAWRGARRLFSPGDSAEVTTASLRRSGER